MGAVDTEKCTDEMGAFTGSYKMDTTGDTDNRHWVHDRLVKQMGGTGVARMDGTDGRHW